MLQWIDHWDEHRAEICERIGKQKATLKILLKTKNDKYMLERWIRHHLNIVSDKNIIIFDNMSTDAHVGDIYEAFQENVVLARFSGYQDRIHSPNCFPELFEAIRKSCDFFIFLDTDEFLIWMKEDCTYFRDGNLVERVSACRDALVLPGTWLANVPSFDDRFYLYSGEEDTDDAWIWGLQWGKPMFSSKTRIRESCLHNCYVDLDIYKKRPRTNLFVLHVSTFSAEQRIAANLNKLRALRFIGDEDGISSLSDLEVDRIDSELIRGYCREIKRIQDDIELHTERERLQDHTIGFDADGKIRFFNDVQRQRLQFYLDNPNVFLSRILAK